MGLLFSSRSNSSKLHAQTNFGGDGFNPEGEEEYKALQGIEVRLDGFLLPEMQSVRSSMTTGGLCN